MRKVTPNSHQKGGGGQQKMNPQYPHQPRGVRPGSVNTGAPNNNNNKMMNSGGAPPPRRQGPPQQQQQQSNVAPPPLMMNPGFHGQSMAEMVAAMPGHGMPSGNAGDGTMMPTFSYVCQNLGRTASNPAGAPPQMQQQQQAGNNDGSGGVGQAGATNGSNVGQGPAGGQQQGSQVTSASPPLMQQQGPGGPASRPPGTDPFTFESLGTLSISC